MIAYPLIKGFCTADVKREDKMAGLERKVKAMRRQTKQAEKRAAKGAKTLPMSFKVFVCSTFSDLSEEREAVLDAIRRLQLEHDSMEFFGARAQQPIETCLKEVRASDVLVVIVGHRYGSLVPGLGISYSEAEYSEGFNLGKPCLVYMRSDDVPTLPKYVERDPDSMKLLDKWKATLHERHTVAPFQDGARLAVQVAADLGRTIRGLEDATSAAPPSTDVDIPAEIQNIIEIMIVRQKGVLVLGSFTEPRKRVLDGIREKLRELGYVPMLADFARPPQRNFTEWVRTLAGLSCFIIADITNPKSSPLELEATVPNYMIPIVPIIQADEQPYSMFTDLKRKYEWVLDVLSYNSVDDIVTNLEEKIIKPALAKSNELAVMKARPLIVKL